MCVCVCVCVRAFACVRACVRACVCVCVCVLYAFNLENMYTKECVSTYGLLGEGVGAVSTPDNYYYHYYDDYY